MTEDSYSGFLERLESRNHKSPLEHATMTVEVTTSRDVLAEITRHRLASFSVQSQRYVRDNKIGDISFIRPNFWIPQSPPSLDAKAYCASRGWEQTCEQAERYYKYFLDECGMNPQDARKILPNSTACHLIMTANIREWQHIFDLRDSDAAYPEMQTLMREHILPAAREVYPGVFDNVGKDRKKDGQN